MAIKDWPAGERPREKLLQRGAAALSDAELLAIFLRTGCRGRSAVDLARELLAKFGSLRVLLRTGHREFTGIAGLGTAKYIQLQAALEIGRRHWRELLDRGNAIDRPDESRRYLQTMLRDRRREIFAALFLDNRHRVIAYEELFKGTIDAAAVYPRVVVEKALGHHASAIIIAHNHPSGDTEPSAADQAITYRLREALALLEIRLLDHFIIGDGDPVSLAEQGLI